MATVNDILNQARVWLNKNEADGSHMDIINVYNSHTPLARGYKVKSTDSWCAVYVSAVAIKCNATNIIPTECGAEQMVKLLKNMGVWQEDGNYTPKSGDIIFYDWDGKDTWSDHVGIVESVENNKITVLEGNKSNAVGRRTLTVGNDAIRGYGVINYDGTQSTTQPTPQPTPQQSQPSKPSGYDEWIARLQAECNAQGFSNQTVDGINGPNTLAGCPTVKKGARGNITKLIQERLNSVGFILSTDGIFGNDTKNAVVVFQRNRGLSQDGIVGKNTWSWLLKGTKM